MWGIARHDGKETCKSLVSRNNSQVAKSFCEKKKYDCRSMLMRAGREWCGVLFNRSPPQQDSNTRFLKGNNQSPCLPPSFPVPGHTPDPPNTSVSRRKAHTWFFTAVTAPYSLQSKSLGRSPSMYCSSSGKRVHAWQVDDSSASLLRDFAFVLALALASAETCGKVTE